MALKYKVLIGIAVFGALVVTPAVTFLAMYSTDEPPPDDSDLRLTLPDVPDHLNAYPLLVEAGEKVYWPEDDATKEKLDRMLAGGPWDAALARDVLERNREALALFEKAMARPHCRFPKFRSYDEIPNVYPLYQIGNILTIRSGQERADGSLEVALDTAITQVRFADRLERAKGSLMCHWVSQGVRRTGYAQIRRLATEATLPPAKWRDYADRLAALAPAPEAFADAFRVEYGFCSEFVDGLRSGKYDPGQVGPLPFDAVPFLPYALHVNRTKHLMADAARTGIEAAGQPYCEALPAIRAWRKRLGATRSASWLPHKFRPNALGWAVFEGLLSPPEYVAQRRCGVAVSGAVTQAMLGLKAYKTRHGRLPQTNDLIVP